MTTLTSNNSVPTQPTTSGLKVTLKSLYDFTGKSLSITLSYKDFELDEAESETLAEQTDGVIAEFFPNTQNKWVKLGALVVSIIGIFGKKWFSYEKAKKPDISVKAESPKKEETKPHLDEYIREKTKAPKDPPKSLSEELGLENH